MPKHFINHATSLRQTCVHCGRFSTAATRRCMVRVSVPSVGVSLSAPLGVIGLVGHYPTNYLIPCRPLLKRIRFTPKGLSSISPSFDGLFLTLGQVPTCYYLVCHSALGLVRLACLIHVASVHPELGSNS